jgi:hypothetical protein
MLVICTFSGNSARVGGGVYNDFRCDLMLTNCAFSGNSADMDGGGMANVGSPTVTNCIFSGNTAISGGGMYNWLGSATLTECTFASNSARNGSAIDCNYVELTPQRYLKLTNCILWDGGNEIWNNSGSTIDITYSDVRGGQGSVYDPHKGVIWGEANIDADPLFTDPGHWADANDPNIVVEPNDPNAVWVNGDYHLKSEAGRWDPNRQSWVQDDVTSPCIDAGDPNSCLGFHEPYPNGLVINMGAYGGTAEASMSLSPDKCNVAWWAFDDWVEVGEPVCWCYRRQCQGDADCKSQGKQKYWVSTNDLDVLIAAWNKTFAETEGETIDGVPLICADFDNQPQGKQKFRVSTNDLDILIHYWQVANGPAPDCP